MNKIEEALWGDYEKTTEQLEGLEVGTEKYKEVLKERDSIRNELIKMEQVSAENGVKIFQVRAEDRREKIRNRITIGTFIVSTGLSMYAIGKTFKFDQESTVTSTLGRGILNGFIPKVFKR